MRQYDVVSRIFLILSTINFVIAAPVLVQDKRQACLDVVHNPEGAITVLGGRGGDEVELVEFFDKLLTKPESSGSAPSNPDHGVTNVVDGPPPTRQSPTVSRWGGTGHCRAQCWRIGLTRTVHRWGRMRRGRTQDRRQSSARTIGSWSRNPHRRQSSTRTTGSCRHQGHRKGSR